MTSYHIGSILSPRRADDDRMRRSRAQAALLSRVPLRVGGWVVSEGKLPLGQLPVLFVDEKPYVQSIAILRYVGKLAGAYYCMAWGAGSR